MKLRVLLAITTALGASFVSSQAAQTAQSDTPKALLGVPLSPEYQAADRMLAQRLNSALGTQLRYDDTFNSYGDLIERVATTSEPFLARMTPYAFVAAEMLGARLEVLATYKSAATGTTTYRSYFVVNKQRFVRYSANPPVSYPATLDGIYDYLRELEHPARFIYHDQFSTSSYLLPALWFRSHRVFATDHPANSVVRVEAVKGSSSSGDSVKAVVEGRAELAAVWDGAKSEYANNKALIFVPLSLTLPNDLLVACASLDEHVKADIRQEIDRNGTVNIGDFQEWRTITQAPETLDALNELKRLARAAPAPVVVRVDVDKAGLADDNEMAMIEESARQAIRLAGTELVLEDPKYHSAADVIWTMKWVHEGAILLVSEMQVPNAELKQRLRQEFHISYTPTDGDLTTRIVALIHARMHRIRYIWPYQDKTPTVIRDVDFTIPRDEKVFVQRLTWRDPDKNSFVPGETFAVMPARITPATFTFDKTGFRTDSGVVDFQNPLSDVAYKVILERRANESTLSKALTATFVGLFLLAGTGAAFDMRRRLLPPKPDPPRRLPDVCATLAARLHEDWIGHALTDARLLCCNRPRVEEHIEELKARGLVSASMGGITRLAYSVTAGGSLPFIKGILSGEIGRTVELVLDQSKVGDTMRLNALLDLLMRKRLLSSFVGRPLEWDALNELARAVLSGAESGDSLIRPEDDTVVKIASRHFTSVLDDGTRHLSLVRGAWMISARDNRPLAQQRIDLRGPIAIRDRRVSSLLLEFNIAAEADLPIDPASNTLDCCVLGKIIRSSLVEEAGEWLLRLHLRTVALILDDDAGVKRADSAPPWTTAHRIAEGV